MADHSQAFNADGHLQRSAADLVRRHGIVTIVETGTFHGVTTAYLASLGPRVHTIELREDFWRLAAYRLDGLANVHLHMGNSPEVLRSLLIDAMGPFLFFLDAHWGAYCPLRDELAVIGALARDSVVLIHDFQVPDRDFGYDTYGGKPYNMKLIDDLLPTVYPSGYVATYNREAEGARRGVLFLEPAAKIA